MDDLIVLVADKNTEAVIETLLSHRVKSLNVRQIIYKIFVHPHRDSGLVNESHEFLRQFSSFYRYAIVLFDRDGCGDSGEQIKIEQAVEERLNQSGWQNRCSVIVIVPELETWMWSTSPHVAKALGWKQLELNGFIQRKSVPLLVNGKPERPKEVIESALREKKIPRSSFIYSEIASAVSIEKCSDPSFIKFKLILQQWFPFNVSR